MAVAVLACLPPAAHAQVTLLVTGTDDPSPVPFCGATRIPQTSGSVSCPSLRAAIRHANTNGNIDTDTIVLQGGSTYLLRILGINEDNGLTGDLDIRSNVRITANATALGRLARVTGSIDRVFDVHVGVVQIENLLVNSLNVPVPVAGSGGGIRNQDTLTLIDSIVQGLEATDGGGGIANQGTLTLINSDVNANGASFGGGISNGGTLTVTSSAINGNGAGGGDGGGIHNSGKATVTNSRIAGNQGPRSGAGIVNLGTLELTGTTVEFNGLGCSGACLTFVPGGGILNRGRLSVTKSTISSNHGTGIVNAEFGELLLNNSTVSSNQADGVDPGAGINNLGTAFLLNATIALNEGRGVSSRNFFNTVNFFNTILADDCEGTLVSNDYNLFQFPTCTIVGSTTHDKIGVDPLLGALRFNGGETYTHAPAAGSPAIDNGSDLVCQSPDQRGTTRPLDGNGDSISHCDIGAVEVRPLIITSRTPVCCLTVATTSGILDLTPTEATVRVGERFAYAFEWTVPQGGWRSLDTLELRLVNGAEVILRVRFAEAADPPGSVGTFSLVKERTGREGRSFAPGSRNRLETEAATVYLDGSAAHGPPGSTVGLTLELSFKPQAGGRSYAVEVLATEDAGAETGFVAAGTLTVLPAKP
jgi:hypothetical protein